MNYKKYLYILNFFIPILVMIFIKKPNNIVTEGWYCLAIFLTTIWGIINQILPVGVLSIISLSILTITNTLTIEEALSGYKESAIWIVLIAFFISKAFIKTKLGERISYYFIKIFGKNILGLAYGFSLSELILSPAIPSATARSGGIIAPIISSVSKNLGSYPKDKELKKLGEYLMLVSFQNSIVSGSMFLTSMSANPIICSIAKNIFNIHITWNLWAISSFIPCILCILLNPLIIYYIVNPKYSIINNTKIIAKNKLYEMGSLSYEEKIMLLVLILIVILWILGPSIGINSVAVAFVGLSILLIFKVLTWEELLREEKAWDSFIWFGALLTIASNLNKLGVIKHFSNLIFFYIPNIHWKLILLLLSLIYFYSHYFFASTIAHVSAMYTSFIFLANNKGVPTIISTLLLAFMSSLFGGITHYGIGSATIFLSYKYVSLKTWWKVGFISSIVNILIFIIFGGLWWKFLKYY